MNDVAIIELPFNLGLKEPAPGKEPGVKKLADWFRRHNFHNLIAPAEEQRLEPPPYRMDLAADSRVLNTEAIRHYAKGQASLIGKVLKEKKFPLVLGGDCSIMTGTALALNIHGRYGLFYLDGHTDFMGPDLSQTGAAGGMAAAIVAGLGDEKLTNIENRRPYIREEHIWCVGNREYNEAYENVIRRSRAEYASLDALRERGITECVNSFLEMIATQNLDGFWIHIDVDVLDDDVMPAVDSRTPGGMTYSEFNRLLYPLLSNPKAAGLEITILDPDLDPDGRYTKEFIKNFTQTFSSARHDVNRMKSD